jgi:hypothetical protein
MSQYFIKGVNFADRATVDKHGIGYAFGDHICCASPAGGGPLDAGSGCYVSRHDNLIGGLPGWTWEQISETVYFGWRPQDGPNEYARETQISGEEVTLADGRPWLIPVAYEYHQTAEGLLPGTRLPQTWQSVGGNWVPGKVVNRYAALWSTAVDVAAKYFGAVDSEQQSSGVTIAEVLNLAVQALQANYYLGPDECSHLGLLANTPEIMRGVTEAVFGINRLMELQKKTALS